MFLLGGAIKVSKQGQADQILFLTRSSENKNTLYFGVIISPNNMQKWNEFVTVHFFFFKFGRTFLTWFILWQQSDFVAKFQGRY